LWQDSRRSDESAVSHGLRLVQLGPRGARVNGRALLLQGQEVEHCSDADAREMRHKGVNLWLVPAQEASRRLWDQADRLGFFIVGRVASSRDYPLIQQLDRQTSCLGWVVPEIEPFRGCHGFLGMWASGPNGGAPA